MSEDRGEIAEVARLFPEALDYVDVYDRAGGLGARTVLAHAVHLSDRELGRLIETGTRVAHCPVSNLFLASGMMPLGRYLDAGLASGWGRTWPAARTCRSSRSMRTGFYVQNARRVAGVEAGRVLAPLDWLRLGSLGGAQALGLDDVIGSLEVGKEADLIAVDPAFIAPVPGVEDDDPADIASRLIFRSHPDMVRAAWVRGRRLEGPGREADAPSRPSSLHRGSVPGNATISPESAHAWAPRNELRTAVRGSLDVISSSARDADIRTARRVSRFEPSWP